MTVRTTTRRFARPIEPKGIELTEDDISILWHVFRHRVIGSESLYALFPNRSKQTISRRLRKLWEGEYIDRPVAQNHKNRVEKGSSYLVYAIAKEGARVLRDRFDAPIAPERWKFKNKNLKPLSIQHHLSITRFMVELAVSVSRHPDASIDYADTLLTKGRAKGRESAGLSNTLRAQVRWHGRTSEEGTAPDQIFAVTIKGERQYIFLEIDEGSETIEPGFDKVRSERFWRETSFLRKMVIYATAFRQKAATKQFGLPVFRVLTVTTSPDRVETMKTAYKRHLSQGDQKTPPGLFLFTDWPTITAHRGSILSLPLQNGLGREVRLDQ